jgi:hypothetical protein
MLQPLLVLYVCVLAGLARVLSKSLAESPYSDSRNAVSFGCRNLPPSAAAAPSESARNVIGWIGSPFQGQ